MKKPKPIPHRARMNQALQALDQIHVSVEDVMAYWLALFEKREVVDQMIKDGRLDATVVEWLIRVKLDKDYPVTLGNYMFDRAIAMAERYRL